VLEASIVFTAISASRESDAESVEPALKPNQRTARFYVPSTEIDRL